MVSVRLRAWLVPLLLVCGFFWPAGQLLAQFAPFWLPASGPSFEVSDSVQLDEAGSAAKKQFEQARAFLANQQWAEAIDILRRIMETHGDKVVGVDDRRYLNVRDYCQLQLAELPAEALVIYRQLADPQAKQWYEQGIARRDATLLHRVVQNAFCSRWGDDALLALGELSLEEGNASQARGYWERILPVSSRPEGRLTRLTYPDTDIAPAEVHSRLVLASLLDGSKDRAEAELQRASTILSAATGRLAGRQGNYAELLGQLLESVTPPAATQSDAEWTTFAGSTRRQHPISGDIDIGPIAWSQPLKYESLASEYKGGPMPVAESAKEPLSYHPIVAGDHLVVLTRIREDEVDRSKLVQDLQVFDLRTGKPAWGDGHLPLPIGQRTSSHQSAALGIPRYTITAYGQKLFVRIGNPVTCVPLEHQFLTVPQSLVCLDLVQEGKVLWSIGPGEDKWAFEGAPVCDGASVYIGMRRSDVRPQAHVACYDAQTGALRWRRFISAAETPGQGQMDEITNNLLTLDGDRLYYNTNLGAVAAIDTRDGHVAWVYRYHRAQKDIEPRNDVKLCFARDLNPCVVDRGRVFVAPSDSLGIFCLDAQFGELCWETNLAPDVVHLLGIVDGRLVATGGRVYFIQAEPTAAKGPEDKNWQIGGKIVHMHPEQGNQNKRPGFGRGVIVGHQVYFPTHDEIWVFDAAQSPPSQSRTIELTQTRGAEGGNLLVAAGHLFITTNNRIYAFEQGSVEK